MHDTDEYLVYDPTLSPDDFELFVVPSVPFKTSDYDVCEESEWPPSTLILPVFLSKSGSWEERAFAREGEAAGTLPMPRRGRLFDHQCAYWRGALYVCCSDRFVMRLSLSDNKYRVIRLPTEGDGEFYLGKSIKGVYCGSFSEAEGQLWVWFLNDQCGEWVLKHDKDIFPFLPNLNFDELCDGPWNLQTFHYWGHDDIEYPDLEDNIKEAIVEDKFEWDSDNDSVLEPGNRCRDSSIVFLGFHPYKEVVFLSDKFDRVLAYNWSSSKIQDLGKLFPKFYTFCNAHYYHPMVVGCFPYTPCWLGELPQILYSEAQLEAIEEWWL